MARSSSDDPPGRPSVLLVRHGETQWNLEGRCLGWSDLPLNDTGRKQAQALAEHLAARRIEAIATSSLQRARMTADAIAERHPHLEPEPQDGLREIDHGLMEGVPFHHLPAKWPEQHDCWTNRPGDLAMPEGETVASLQERALAAFDALTMPWLEKHRRGDGEGDLVLVAHNLTIGSIMCDIVGVPLHAIKEHMLHNCGYHELRHDGERWVCVETWPARNDLASGQEGGATRSAEGTV